MSSDRRQEVIIASPKRTSGQPHAGARCLLLDCPRCGLSLLVQPHRAAIRHCPRCVGRNRLIVELSSSRAPAEMLHTNLRRARPPAPVNNRPMAAPIPAIDERPAPPQARPRLVTCPSCSPAGRAGCAKPQAVQPARGGLAMLQRQPAMELAYALLVGGALFNEADDTRSVAINVERDARRETLADAIRLTTRTPSPHPPTGAAHASQGL